MPANEPMNESHCGTSRPKALPTMTPPTSSISATDRPISTLIVDAIRTVRARTAAIAMSLSALYLLGVRAGRVEAISG
jgi:hypothetical protein